MARAILCLVLLAACGNETPAKNANNDKTTVTVIKPTGSEMPPEVPPPASATVTATATATTPPTPPAPTVDRSTPKAVAEQYMTHAKEAAKESMLGLMTPECQQKEKTWEKGFTKAFTERGVKLKSYETKEIEDKGDVAKVHVRAVYQDGKKDKAESMRFELVKKDGSWWISSIN
jgi:type IV secretory pathway VirB10-like protein